MRPTPAPRRWLFVLVTLAIGVAVVALAPTTQAAVAPTTGTVSGTVWHDLDGDGVRDAGEPGLPKVVITQTGVTPRAVSGADGTWTLTLPAGTTTISAITGWFPSACPGDLYCAARRTAGQDFAVENQFVRAKVTIVAGSAVTGVDLGLAPDYGDPTGSPTSRHTGNDPGDGKALTHDLAARHSNIGWYDGCTDPDTTRVCPIGTKVRNLGQIYNQGTAWVTDIRFVVTVPRGSRLATDPWMDSSTPGAAPVRTGRTGPTADGGTWVEFKLQQNLAPASAVWFRSSYQIQSGPTPTPLGDDYDRKGYVSISGLVPADNDSTLRVDPRLGLDGGHNLNFVRRLDDDTSDAIEFNVG